MKKLIPYFIGIIIVSGLIGGLWFITKPNNSPQQASNTSENENTSDNSGPGNNNDSDDDDETETETAQTFTAAQVAEHDSREDCWTTIRGSVYDLTSFVARHPGGDEILRACGTDATTLFETRTTADGEAVGSGTGHSDSAASQLSSLKIGTLAN